MYIELCVVYVAVLEKYFDRVIDIVNQESHSGFLLYKGKHIF